MTHPLALHAITALWSLRQAVDTAEAAYVTACRAEDEDGDGGTLQAWRPGPGRTSSGGHADVVGQLLGGARSRGAIDRYAGLVDSAQEHVAQVRYLVAAELATTASSIATVEQLADRLGLVRRPIAVEARGWLEQGDRLIRRSLKLDPDVMEVPDRPECPVCMVRMLRLHIAAPADAAWTVVCHAGCRCQGSGCPCGMPEREAGDVHIWAYGTLPQPVLARRGRRE